MDRKTFLEKAFTLAIGKGLKLVEDNPVVRQLESLADLDDRPRHRPPGAIEEELFTERCTGCDACMIACPHHVIMVDDIERRLPVIYPEESPCLHCDGYPCIAACETGALDP